MTAPRERAERTAADRARESAAAQGLPPTIEDPEALDRIAAMIAAKVKGCPEVRRAAA